MNFIERVVTMGCAFISADYRLLPPATGDLIVDDLKDLFAFLDTVEISMKHESSDIHYSIDPNAIIVSGSSSGGLCAYLAASHCNPKPKAVLSMYGMGGNLFVRQAIVTLIFPLTLPMSRVFTI